MAAILSAQDLCYQIGHRVLIDKINLKIEPGESIALLGANGAGKTTLLRLLLGVLPATSGAIYLEGKRLTEWARRDVARRIAYVPQQHTPHFPFTVRQMVEQGRLPQQGLFRSMDADLHERVSLALETMGIADLGERVYTQLSGGERQLVLLARALLQETPLILLDEPTNGLDYGNQLRLLERLRSIADSGRSILTITHCPEHALLAANRVWALQDGRLIADGSPQEIITPTLIHQLYHTEVSQIDSDHYRFFVPRTFVPCSTP